MHKVLLSPSFSGGNLDSSKNFADAVLRNLPRSEWRTGAQIYLELVNTNAYGGQDGNVAGGNGGIIERNQDLLKSSSCFRRTAQAFYQEMERLDVASFDRPTLGKNEKIDGLKPGWLWEKALHAAKGSPNMAMKLINLCGNDDIPITYELSEGSRMPKEAYSYHPNGLIKVSGENLSPACQKLNEAIAKLGLVQPSGKANYSGNYNGMMELNWKCEMSLLNASSLTCPDRGGAMYFPESLGAGVDISKDLKERILKVQNPNGTETIPAKYYHVMSGAAKVCEMMERGVPVDVAVELDVLGSRVYRSIRMCSMLDEINEIEERLISLLKNYFSKRKINFVEADLTLDLKSQVIEELMKSGKRMTGEEFDLYDSLLKSASPVYERRRDAARLYADWYLGGENVRGKRLPCSDIRVGGPKDLLSPESKVGKWWRKPRGWDDKRYEGAKKALATWEVDMKWTAEQHRVGGLFAMENCKYNSKKPGTSDDEKDPFAFACEKPNPAAKAPASNVQK